MQKTISNWATRDVEFCNVSLREISVFEEVLITLKKMETLTESIGTTLEEASLQISEYPLLQLTEDQASRIRDKSDTCQSICISLVVRAELACNIFALTQADSDLKLVNLLQDQTSPTQNYTEAVSLLESTRQAREAITQRNAEDEENAPKFATNTIVSVDSPTLERARQTNPNPGRLEYEKQCLVEQKKRTQRLGYHGISEAISTVLEIDPLIVEFEENSTQAERLSIYNSVENPNLDLSRINFNRLTDHQEGLTQRSKQLEQLGFQTHLSEILIIITLMDEAKSMFFSIQRFINQHGLMSKLMMGVHDLLNPLRMLSSSFQREILTIGHEKSLIQNQNGLVYRCEIPIFWNPSIDIEEAQKIGSVSWEHRINNSLCSSVQVHLEFVDTSEAPDWKSTVLDEIQDKVKELTLQYRNSSHNYIELEIAINNIVEYVSMLNPNDQFYKDIASKLPQVMRQNMSKVFLQNLNLEEGTPSLQDIIRHCGPITINTEEVSAETEIPNSIIFNLQALKIEDILSKWIEIQNVTFRTYKKVRKRLRIIQNLLVSTIGKQPLLKYVELMDLVREIDEQTPDEDQAPPVPNWTNANVGRCLWINPRRTSRKLNIPQERLAGINQVSEYLETQNLRLFGTPSDGDCWFHAFLASYEISNELTLPELDAAENKIQFLRDKIASDRSISQQRAVEIEEQGEWIDSQEGSILARELNVPIRIITLNQDGGNIGIADMLTRIAPEFNLEDGEYGEPADHRLSTQDWNTIEEELRPRNYLIIVDLIGHFVYASDRQAFLTTAPPNPNLNDQISLTRQILTNRDTLRPDSPQLEALLDGANNLCFPTIMSHIDFYALDADTKNYILERVTANPSILLTQPSLTFYSSSTHIQESSTKDTLTTERKLRLMISSKAKEVQRRCVRDLTRITERTTAGKEGNDRQYLSTRMDEIIRTDNPFILNIILTLYERFLEDSIDFPTNEMVVPRWYYKAAEYGSPNAMWVLRKFYNDRTHVNARQNLADQNNPNNPIIYTLCVNAGKKLSPWGNVPISIPDIRRTIQEIIKHDNFSHDYVGTTVKGNESAIAALMRRGFKEYPEQAKIILRELLHDPLFSQYVTLEDMVSDYYQRTEIDYPKHILDWVIIKDDTESLIAILDHFESDQTELLEYSQWKSIQVCALNCFKSLKDRYPNRSRQHFEQSRTSRFRILPPQVRTCQNECKLQIPITKKQLQIDFKLTNQLRYKPPQVNDKTLATEIFKGLKRVGLVNQSGHVKNKLFNTQQKNSEKLLTNFQIASILELDLREKISNFTQKITNNGFESSINYSLEMVKCLRSRSGYQTIIGHA